MKVLSGVMDGGPKMVNRYKGAVSDSFTPEVKKRHSDRGKVEEKAVAEKGEKKTIQG